jgi:hypothetical protein
MVSRSLVLGYHGCDLNVARQIVSLQHQQRPSSNEYDWLGNGLYFWEDSYARALHWAENDGGGKITEPGVLGAIIDLGNCLNLIDAEHLDLVKSAYQTYLQLCEVSGVKPLQNKGKDLRARFLDRMVFETLHQLRGQQSPPEPPFDTVRAFFVEGELLYENAGLHSLDHIQLCVRNPRNIIGYFLPRNV